ncbi:MAG: hypothetical protein HN576_06450 [Bacteriovoracaceae bacterium]|nr:hypothetical protein [Bacteriovoracaceae bacterium]
MSITNNQRQKKEYDERCCQTGCGDCPYDFELELDPHIPAEFQIETLNQSKNKELSAEQRKYLELADLD